jgi:poly-gamma-glutamate synthesis protein (capsule biosynthesis protein)
VDRRTVKGIEVVTSALDTPADAAATARVVDEVSRLATPLNVVIVTFHWGVEHSSEPREAQRAVAHAVIDAGADLVLGTHPHVLQAVEEYRGRHIAYSLGNFVFGGNRNPKDKDTVIYRETIYFDARGIQRTEADVVPAAVTSSADRNDFQPRILSGADAQRVRSRVFGGE